MQSNLLNASCVLGAASGAEAVAIAKNQPVASRS